MEGGDLRFFRESERRLRSAEVRREGFSLRIFSEVHIGCTVEKGVVRTFGKHIVFGEILKRSLDDVDSGKDLIGEFRGSVEGALDTDRFFRTGSSAFTAESAAKRDDPVIGVLFQQSRCEGSSDEPRDSGHQYFQFPSPVC